MLEFDSIQQMLIGTNILSIIKAEPFYTICNWVEE